MDLLSRDNLRELAEKTGKWCVSLFLPTHRASRETVQDRTVLKNLLDQAETQLTSRGLRGPDARDLLATGRALLDDAAFWVHQSDGLNLLLAPGYTKVQRLPIKFRELLVVGERFHLSPLLPMLNGDGTFYVLALNQKNVRVLQGSRWSVRELDLARVPTSLAEALKYDVLEKELNFHTHHNTGAERGKGEAIFHGQGAGGDDTHKRRLRQYFQQIDRGLHELLHDKRAPLVLAGVDYCLPLYREANTYNFLVDGGIEGSPNGLNPQELHALAWPVVEPVFRKKEQEALAAYQQAIGTGRASGDLPEILRAARDGRVGTLFVARDRQQWGKFDAQTGAAEMHNESQAGNQDLLDLAAVQTLLNSGTVYALDPAQMPGKAVAAAVFRY
jgi:hypothetical protein